MRRQSVPYGVQVTAIRAEVDGVSAGVVDASAENVFHGGTELSLRPLRLRSPRLGDPRAQRRANRVTHPLDVSQRGTQWLGHASPRLGKPDLDHVSILP